MPGDLAKALTLIDEAHALDPNKTSSGKPYELHYAERMTHYLDLHSPDASPELQLACRGQHFRRWEVPRDDYPRTKPGYFAWRTFLKKRQGEHVQDICLECGFEAEIASHIGALIEKKELKKGEGKGDAEAQVMEDCACLVFLDDQFDKFEAEMKRGHVEAGNNEEGDQKIISILQKTWVKMGKRGQDLALQMDLSDRAKELVGRALSDR
ncbi:hypothetical protein LTR66_017878, partial [Elasticomyces elasticus]